MKIKNLLWGSLFILSNAYGDNLGVVGKTYPISEPDMIEWIKAKASALVKSGEWQKIQTQAIAKTKEQINHPALVVGISDAVETKNWYYKPMVNLKENLTDGAWACYC